MLDGYKGRCKVEGYVTASADEDRQFGGSAEHCVIEGSVVLNLTSKIGREGANLSARGKGRVEGLVWTLQERGTLRRDDG